MERTEVLDKLQNLVTAATMEYKKIDEWQRRYIDKSVESDLNFLLGHQNCVLMQIQLETLKVLTEINCQLTVNP